MRRGPLAVLGSFALVAAGAASAAVHTPPSPLATSLTVGVSSPKAGARPVAVTLKIVTELQCGRLTGGPLVFRFPAAERLPKTIPASGVSISGQAAESVAVAGRNVTVSLKPRTGIICDVIALGTAPVVFTKSANMGNPVRAGLYTVSLVRGHAATAARFRVR